MRSLILYFIIAVLAIALIYSLLRPNQIETISETVKVVQDTTVVDSLKQRIEYLEEIEEPDTIVVEVPVPEIDTVIIREGVDLNVYYPSYSDDNLVANWRLLIDGELREQNFEYTLRRRLVREDTYTIRESRYVETERIITQRVLPRNYLSVGGFGGYVNETPMLGPSIAYNTPNTTFNVSYDALNGGILVGINTKFSFRNLLR